MRSALEQLPRAARAFSTSALAQAAPALASAPAKSSRSLLSGLFGGSARRVDVPLTDALPGVALPEVAAPPAQAPATQLTKLSNGFTVATEETPVRARRPGGRPRPAALPDGRGEGRCARWRLGWARRGAAAGRPPAGAAAAEPLRSLSFSPLSAGRHRHAGHLCRLRLRVRDARVHGCGGAWPAEPPPPR